SQLLRQAQQFAQGVSSLADQIQSLRTDADSQIETAVESVNHSLTEIDRLNGEIARLAAAGQRTADVEDQRDLAIRELSKQMDVNVVRRSNGTVAVLTSTGRPLISGALSLLSFSPASSVNAAQAYPDQLGGIMLDGVDITGELQSGGLHGLFALRDQTLPQAQGQPDEFVSRLTSDLVNHGLELLNDSMGPTPTLRTVSAAAAAGAPSIAPGAARGGPAGGPILLGSLLRFSN